MRAIALLARPNRDPFLGGDRAPDGTKEGSSRHLVPGLMSGCREQLPLRDTSNYLHGKAHCHYIHPVSDAPTKTHYASTPMRGSTFGFPAE